MVHLGGKLDGKEGKADNKVSMLESYAVGLQEEQEGIQEPIRNSIHELYVLTYRIHTAYLFGTSLMVPARTRTGHVHMMNQKRSMHYPDKPTEPQR